MGNGVGQLASTRGNKITLTSVNRMISPKLEHRIIVHSQERCKVAAVGVRAGNLYVAGMSQLTLGAPSAPIVTDSLLDLYLAGD
jgi:hypothetical protein